MMKRRRLFWLDREAQCAIEKLAARCAKDWAAKKPLGNAEEIAAQVSPYVAEAIKRIITEPGVIESLALIALIEVDTEGEAVPKTLYENQNPWISYGPLAERALLQGDFIADLKAWITTGIKEWHQRV